MINDRALYEGIINLFKIWLLVPPGTANVDCGISILTLLVTKSPQNFDQIMLLVLNRGDQISCEI